MPSIASYQKFITQQVTRELATPEGSTELATLDGTTYVCLPDGARLPEVQHAEIAASIVLDVELTDALRDEIKAVSPHVRLINRRVVDRLRERYSLDDEIKLIRLAPSAESSAYNDYVEECRAWGRAQKAAFGL
jgi:hypothetical protein